MSETSSEVKTHRRRPSDEVLKHNEACRRSRRSYTLCKKAYQLEQAGGGGVQVFALVKDRNGNVTYYASDELERKFENSEPLVEHPSKDKCFHYNPETFGIDLPHLPQVMHPTPDKSPGKRLTRLLRSFLEKCSGTCYKKWPLFRPQNQWEC